MLHVQRVAASLLAICGLTACSSRQSLESASPASRQNVAHDDAAVRATLDSLEGAWNRHDIGDVGRLLTDDVQWIVGNGNCWRNRQQVCEAYEILHGAIAASSDQNPLATLSIENVEMQFPSSQIAIGMATLRFGGTLTTSSSGPPCPTTRASFVMIRCGPMWRIAQFHQTPLDPRVEREDPIWGNPDRLNEG